MGRAFVFVGTGLKGVRICNHIAEEENRPPCKAGAANALTFASGGAPSVDRSVPWVVVFGLAMLLLGLTPTLPAQEPPPASQPIRVDVARVNVGVIVTDAGGKFVEGLQRGDFQVQDNGAQQPITDFAPIEEPAQVLLLIEAGPAVYLLEDTHLFVADTFLSGLSAGDRVAVARYANAPAALLDFTADKRAAQAALDQISFNLGFGDLNLAGSLNTVLGWLEKVPGKKSIVLISTGVDTSPQESITALQSKLRTGDVRILCISMSGPLRNGKAGSKRQIQQTQQDFAGADANLRDLAAATGGRAYFPENGKAFQDAYRQIAELVRHEYSLAFAPPVADGATHTIQVRVTAGENSGKSSEYRVDYRQAYRAPEAPKD
jgi:VWFA-related protein